MHRIDEEGSVAGMFTEGDPGQAIPATVVSDDWLNAVQEELALLIEGMGVTLAKGTNNQLLAACVAAATANRIVRRDASGRAQFADPSANADVDTKGARDTAISTHNGVTNPHSATSAATASRIVLRDAAGRAQFADPSAAQDAATKGYVDTAAAGTLAWGANWGDYGDGASHVKKVGSLVSGYLEAYASSGVSSWNVATLPVGFRPPKNMYVPAYVTHSGEFVGMVLINGASSGTPGVVTVFRYDNGTALANAVGWGPASGDQLRVAFTFFV